jgi:endo-1,4-beta-xylanase
MFEARDRATTLGHLRTHIETVVDRYRSRILGWDVVNEAISDEPEAFLRQSPWTEIVGHDYVVQAFRFAHEVDERVELYYNDYNNERPVKREKTLRLIDAIRLSGTRVDAVGIQGHWELRGIPYDQIEESIQIYAANGLKVMITELDIDVIPRSTSGADIEAGDAVNAGDAGEARLKSPNALPVRHPADQEECPPEILSLQAEAYRRLFELFRSHREHISRITFWGLHDGRSWLNFWPTRRTNHPLLFDRDLRPKPAFHAIANMARR